MTGELAFGVFDHMDDSGAPLVDQYDARLRLIEAYDRAGFYAYHLAEHHGTPHGLAASPSLFLAAAAQRTRRLRLGPMVMLLSLPHPLRAFEEICMLDQLSHGRLELGIGRGNVAAELGFFGVPAEEADSRYREATDVILQAMAGGVLTHHGAHFQIDDVPLTLSPLQRPHPPLWYGTVNPSTATWAAEQGIRIACVGPASGVRKVTDAYRAAWVAATPSVPLPLVGMVRTIVIGQSDAEARAVAAPAFARWFDTLMDLPRRRGIPAPFGLSGDLDENIARGHCIIGSVTTVREALAQQVAEAGVSYIMCQIAFGDLPVTAALETVAALRSEIMPAFEPAAAA